MRLENFSSKLSCPILPVFARLVFYIFVYGKKGSLRPLLARSANLLAQNALSSGPARLRMHLENYPTVAPKKALEQKCRSLSGKCRSYERQSDTGENPADDGALPYDYTTTSFFEPRDRECVLQTIILAGMLAKANLRVISS